MTEVFPQMLSKHSDPPPDGQASPLLASFVTLFIHLPDVHDAVSLPIPPQKLEIVLEVKSGRRSFTHLSEITGVLVCWLGEEQWR